MQHVADTLVFSPSDLNGFLECEHLVQLQRTRHETATPRRRDAHAELLAAKGLEHERAWLQRFRNEGRTVVDIGSGGSERDWERDAGRTLDAMHAGVDVIYQGVLLADGWRGISDFLVRTGTPSALGDWSYEAWDAKLARHSKPYFILQLCYYSGEIGRLQGRDPAEMHVILGTGESDHFRYAHFASYYRVVRRRFLEAAASSRPTYPHPVEHCGLCEYDSACEERRHADDHLSLVADIRRQQVQRLNEAAIDRVEQLATISPDLRLGIGRAPLERLRHQAALQTHHRRTGSHRCDLLPVDERSGFRLLPAPSPGDIFFDMEGDPYFEPSCGLEYLFGAVTQSQTFNFFRATTRAEEKVAFEGFIDFVHERLRTWPDLHVFHYASYEPATLKRLMSQHATREEELDDLLRREVFVDLYQVVRQSLRISHPSYSIKKVRTFFMPDAGKEEACPAGAPEERRRVTEGGDSIIAFERWRTTRDPAILQAIVDYNEEDCVSTLKLRDWLLERRAEAERLAGVAIPWKSVEPPKENSKKADEYAHLKARLISYVGRVGEPLDPVAFRPAESDADDAHGPEYRRVAGADDRRGPALLLLHLLDYHRREAKPAWWAYYERHEKSLDDLLDDTEAIAYLEPVEGVEPVKVDRSLVHTLQFPRQEFKLAPDTRQVEDPFRQKLAGSIAWLDEGEGRLGLKRGATRAEPLPSAVVVGKPLDNSVQRAAIGRVADAILAGNGEYRAVRDLLARALPRVRERARGSSLQTMELSEQKALVAALDSSYLFIQGPPGSGKTWAGARLIVSLIAGGKRVGVSATSHKAINNLLREVEKVALEEGVTFAGLKKGEDDDELRGRLIADTSSNEECESSDAQLIAGTSWLFARANMTARLDYLFIDEAGQVSLADAVATGTAARNIVLLGDPQQLAQVRQGVHPVVPAEPNSAGQTVGPNFSSAARSSGCSVLEHLLGEVATVSEDRGLFLANSWRMHPEVCRFVSEHSYEGRLQSAPGCERQVVSSPGLSGAGLRYIPIEHRDNSQQSPEEADAIAAEVRLLLAGGTFTDRDGLSRPLAPPDILVVAPYNMQVRCLREALPDDVEVGTVDKFQGREAAVVFFSMASSSGEDVPRGLAFLFNRNRFNVAISRAKCLSVVVCSPRLMEARCRTVREMGLVNALCRFTESAAAGAVY
jgi:predicted RecB family nuclease